MSVMKGRYRLLVTISVLFTTLIVVFGLVFRQYTYQKMSEIIYKESEKYFSQINEELSLEYISKGDLVAQTVKLLSQSGIVTAKHQGERLDYLPLFKEALNGKQGMSALQVGYDDGDFFIVRLVDSEKERLLFSSPPQTRFVVDEISGASDKQRYLERIWFSESLVELKRAAPIINEYDPRLRPWFKESFASPEPISTQPYLFHFSKQVGVTIAYRHPKAGAVVAGDVTLEHLSEVLEKYHKTPRTEVILFEKSGDKYWVMAHKDYHELTLSQEKDGKRIHAGLLKSSVIKHAAKQPDVLKESWQMMYENERWIGSTRNLKTPRSERYFLVTMSPEVELMSEAIRMQSQAMRFTFIMILLTIPITWFLASRISTPIQALVKDANRISKFEFENKTADGSFIKEVDDLDRSMRMMESTISKFISLIHSLSSEQDLAKLLKRITKETMLVSEADGAFAYILDESAGKVVPGAINTKSTGEMDFNLLPSFDLDGDDEIVRITTGGEREIIPIEKIFSKQDLGLFEVDTAQVVAIPLQNRQQEGIGLLCLVFKGDKLELASKEQEGRLAFIEALSGFAAVTLESRKMLFMQKELLESFIKLLAGAIDSKSPYTGGHCQRVPVLTKALAKVACESDEGVFADFSLSDEEWEAIHIASWLHDCGKVTTPEYVVDKSTKLETIYDRIHEVRTRFEVLKRDAHIRYYEALLQGGDQLVLQEELKQEWQGLDADFTFLAECNLGGEFMAPQKVERLQEIAQRTWMRTLSDRVGISWEERKRKERTPEKKLPVEENLLADREDHLFERDEKHKISEDNEYGFKLDTPKHLYNRGEIYNLSVARGTLTNEERYHINDHIVQTIIMLKKLPYPKHLVDVPDIAGGHHEKIDGTGYPRQLDGDQMSMPAKIMVIADIFEALTASDRPYKQPKTLSESIKIMGFMLKDNHIDGDLFRLFLKSGVYKEYADQYLREEQIDEVDVETYLTV